MSMPSRRVGLARALSKLGYCSRNQAFDVIRGGRVTLNGRVVRNPETPVDLAADDIAVDGAPVAAAPRMYLMLNKPRGLVTTASDEKGRATIYSILPADLPLVNSVGRLDKASEGLLLLTNDSEWAAHITAPESHVAKTYHVQISGEGDEALLRRLRQGIRDRGEYLRARRVSVLREGGKNSWLEMVLDEGKNRQIRRMLAAVDREVLCLVRVAVGPVTLGDLPKGKTRHLTSDEINGLKRASAPARLKLKAKS